MKKIALHLLALMGAGAYADSLTVIQKNTITYAHPMTIPAIAPNVPTEHLAAIGGKVDFTGPGPVYVTLAIGGQNYTALTDNGGQYSYLVWANADQFQAQAWTIPGQTPATNPPTEPPAKPVNPAATVRASLK